MDDALWTDTLTFAVETEVEDLLVPMLPADLVAGYASGQCILAACRVGRVFAHWLPLVSFATVLLHAFFYHC